MPTRTGEGAPTTRGIVPGASEAHSLPNAVPARDVADAHPARRSLVPVFVLLFSAGTLGRALNRPLWYDELFTFYLATGTTVRDLWQALAAGIDLHPPLYYLAVRAAAVFVGPGALATRLPSLIGFLMASLALYVFMRRRVDASFALVAAIVPSLTGVYMYAYEGRPYGLVLGFSALALVAWQARGDSHHRLAPIGCALALAAASFSHYYAVLIVLPLAAGELVRVAYRRRLDWPMWIAFAFAGLPLLLLRPLIQAARRFAPTFWARPSASDVVDQYRQLIDPLSLIMLGAAACITVAAVSVERVGSASKRLSGAERPHVPSDELTAALALLAVPLAGYLLAVLVTGAFHERYVLQRVLGLSILVSWWSAAIVRSRRHQSILVAVLFLAFAARQAGGALSLIGRTREPMAASHQMLSSVPDTAPVVVSNALTFLPMVYYSTAATARAGPALTFLTRPPDVVQQLGDTGGRALRLLSQRVPLDVEDYDTFVRMHDRFYVYGPRSWLIPRLLAHQADVRLVREQGDILLYAVNVP